MEIKKISGLFLKDETARNLVESLRETFLSHTHGKSDIVDFEHEHTKEDITDFEHTHVMEDITDFEHTHTREDITDFEHTHSKTDIVDFEHTHTKEDITDFDHGHDVGEVSGAVSKVLLWENASPSNSFPEQSVKIKEDYTGYDEIEIMFIDYNTDLTRIQSHNIPNILGKGCTGVYIGNGVTEKYRRGVVLESATYIYFQSCYVNMGGTIDDKTLIPYRIYGIKGVQ